MCHELTVLDLDMTLIKDAQSIYGTEDVADTIHHALEDAIRRHRLQELLKSDIPSITPEDLECVRGGR